MIFVFLIKEWISLFPLNLIRTKVRNSNLGFDYLSHLDFDQIELESQDFFTFEFVFYKSGNESKSPKMGLNLEHLKLSSINLLLLCSFPELVYSENHSLNKPCLLEKFLTPHHQSRQRFQSHMIN